MINPAVVVLAHNRPEDLEKVLHSLMSLHNIVKNYKVFVSMDDPSFFSALESVARSISPHIKFWHSTRPNIQRGALYKISAHFEFALESGFEQNQHSHLILLEDDLIVAHDFLQLFESTAWLLDDDTKNTWCVSAWNDNGLKATTTTGVVSGGHLRGGEEGGGGGGGGVVVHDARRRLLRTGYFPGLGWMTTQRMWREELKSIWPKHPSTGWDHYIRQQTETSGKRECIYPEIPRTRHISKHGSNVNTADQVQRFALYNFHEDDTFNDDDHPFGDTSYLRSDMYHRRMSSMVRNAQVVRSINDIATSSSSSQKNKKVALVYYYLRENFESLCRQISLPRTQPRGWHRGVLQTRVPGSPTVLLLIDKRTDDYVPEKERLLRPEGVVAVGGGNGENCDVVCQKRGGGKRCSKESLEFLNKCTELKKIFHCENGCGHQVGAEIPCYVEDRNQPTHHQCLVTDGGGAMSCKSSHKSTQRLCGCV